MTRIGYALGLFATAAVVLAGCGGGGPTTSGENTGETTAAGKPATETQASRPKKGAWGAVFGAESADLGIILFDLSGHTLYRFDGDKGPVSSCYGPCARHWPPALTEGKLRAVDVPREMVGTTQRKDGTVQLTYDGHPLYTFGGDRQGDTNGDGIEAFGAKWHALRPSGRNASG